MPVNFGENSATPCMLPRDHIAKNAIKMLRNDNERDAAPERRESKS